MQYQYNDGGRKAAGFLGKTGDCVTRAIVIATGLPYQKVYDDMAAIHADTRITKRTVKSAGRRTARSGIYTNRKAFKDYMLALGWVWMPTMAIGTGCTMHLDGDELPKGRLIVRLSKHCVAVVDGVIHDTYDPNDRGETIYPPNHPNVPAAAVKLENGNGWAYAPKRCVYGYWSKA